MSEQQAQVGAPQVQAPSSSDGATQARQSSDKQQQRISRVPVPELYKAELPTVSSEKPQPQSQDRGAMHSTVASEKAPAPAGRQRERDGSHAAVSLHGYRKLTTGDELRGLTPKAFSEDESADLGRTFAQRIGYLEGLRGLLAFEVLLWSFFRLLAPAIATDTDLDNVRPAPFVQASPAWHSVLRKALSPLLWDGSLQSTFFFILSARVVANTYLERRNNTSLAGATFRRPLRLLPPVMIVLAIVSVMSATRGFAYADELASALQNTEARAPQAWFSAIEYFDALTAYFFDNTNDLRTAPVRFIPPTPIMWFVERVFIQSFSVYTFAVLLPYTLTKYKARFGLGLMLWAYWIGSFAWYSLTGLLLAELVVAYDLPALAARTFPPFGARVPKLRLPAWLPPVCTLALGVLLKYLWAAAFPSRADDEYAFHTNRITGVLNRGFNPQHYGYPRIDDWLVAASALVLIEMSGVVRRVFDNVVLKALGRISFSLFLIGGTVNLSLGSLLFHHLVTVRGWAEGSARLLAVQLAVCIPAALLVATALHLAVEAPGCSAARKAYIWITKE